MNNLDSNYREPFARKKATIQEDIEKNIDKVSDNEKYVKLFNEQEIAKYILSVATNTFNPKDYPYQTILSP